MSEPIISQAAKEPPFNINGKMKEVTALLTKHHYDREELENIRKFCLLVIESHDNTAKYLNGVIDTKDSETASLRAAIAVKDEALRRWQKVSPQIDDGSCAVCRVGTRFWIAPYVAGRCSNDRCLSSQIKAALAVGVT